MELASTAINAAVMTAIGLVLAWLGKARFDALERRMDRLEASVNGSLNALRSDLTQVALAVGARPRAENA
jgi:hypothetical protein